ncbi:MAG: alkaline phosphatase [Solirubrobacteraceae bacterium]|nr:alkaline phosphatase [Solirubrobacteraceae bacterium]
MIHRFSRRGALAAGGLSAALLASAAAALAVGPLGFADRSADLAAQIDSSKPRNVILLIGDGTDESMITAARNYALGANGRFELDKLPFVGDMTVHGLKTGPGPDYPINYVSDSAPTASAWSTGRKTVDGRVSQGPSIADTVPGEDYVTVLEQYRAEGKRTGNVTTSEITDATPAAAASHINARACQGPADMGNCAHARKVNGGKGSIAEQLVDNRIDVILGGGLSRFNQNIDAGGTVLNYAQNSRNYHYVDTRAALEDIETLSEGPILGLFANGNMTPRYNPLVAQPGGVGGPDTRCTVADRGIQPSLAQMTRKAIQLLDNSKGFFLQVESAMVDKQEHAADICGAIGDVVVLDEAVKVALDYQRSNPDTLIIVTSDHAHSTQIVPGANSGVQTATVRTADGDPMTVAYSTQAVGSSHTGSTVRVAAKGPQGANVTGLIDQTDLYATLLGRGGSQPTPPPAGPPPTGGGVSQPGPAGAPGAPGAAGAPGTTGVAGAPGTDAAASIALASDGRGDRAVAKSRPTTTRTPAARATTCRVSKDGRSISCGVRAAANPRAAKASVRTFPARLVRQGRVIARGKILRSNGRVTLRSPRRIGAGSYTVVAAGKRYAVNVRR